MDERRKRRGWFIVGSFLAVTAYIVYAHHAPAGGFVGCPFHLLTGYSCFGCGMTRSTGFFLHGDVVQSLRYHPFGGLFVVSFAAVAIHRLVENLRGEELDYGALRLWRRWEKRAVVLALISLLGFGVVRFALELAGILTPI